MVMKKAACSFSWQVLFVLQKVMLIAAASPIPLRRLRKNEMEQSQLGLKGSRAEWRLSVVSQNDKVVFSRHAGQDRRLVKHGLDVQWRRAGVFEGLAGFQNGLAARDSGSTDHVLVRQSHGLDLKSAGDELDGILGLVGDSNAVGKAVLVLAGFRALGAVDGCQTDTAEIPKSSIYQQRNTS